MFEAPKLILCSKGCNPARKLKKKKDVTFPFLTTIHIYFLFFFLFFYLFLQVYIYFIKLIHGLNFARVSCLQDKITFATPIRFGINT